MVGMFVPVNAEEKSAFPLAVPIPSHAGLGML